MFPNIRETNQGEQRKNGPLLFRQMLPSDIGIILYTITRIPFNQPGFNGKYPVVFFRGSGDLTQMAKTDRS